MSINQEEEDFRRCALAYHALPTPGKISVVASKLLVNQRDLSLAYSPGVASACEEIARDPEEVHRYTTRSNLVAVISNGTAVLGLGAIGPLAAKPVMEGKAVLFKKFAGIDVFDIEIDERDPERLIEIIASLEPTFGGINLEDIKAPDCFRVERGLRERMGIPVFHDDQHGTAIVVAAALLNGLKVVAKNIHEIKVVVSGAGAAALACLNLLVDLGLPKKNIWVNDLSGLIYQGRGLMDPEKEKFAQATTLRTLAEAINDADVFLGLSVAGVLKPEMVARMANNPLIFALANPVPEILPEDIQSVRSDAIIATGRADYPNQVNNVLCFPFIFRGALDCGATKITREMEIAAVHAIANLAQIEVNDDVNKAYQYSPATFGPEYLIPKPFDPRLITMIAPAVAKAAMEAGIAKRPIQDFDAYLLQLQQFVYHSSLLMKPIFAAVKKIAPEKKRLVFAEGEDKRVLQAAQVLVDEKIAMPILIGRPQVLEQRIARLNLRIRLGVDVLCVNPESDDRYRDYWQAYHQLAMRQGVSKQYAQLEIRRRFTLIAAIMVLKNHADSLICGLVGKTHTHLHYIDQVIGLHPEAKLYAAMSGLILSNRQLFLVDTHINHDPDAEQLAHISIMAAHELQRLGIEPKVALLSHSNFGSNNTSSALKMRNALALLRKKNVSFEVDGEMHGDSALDPLLRENFISDSPLNGGANLLVMPNLDAAHIAYCLLKTTAGHGITVGPILLGAAKPAHILTPSATVRRIINIAALAVLDAMI